MPSDTADKVNYDKAAQISKFMALVARSIGTSAEAPDYIAMEAPKNQGTRTGLRVYFGTITKGYLEQALPRIIGEGCERAFDELLNRHPLFERIPPAAKDLVRRRVSDPFSGTIMEIVRDKVREEALALACRPGVFCA